MFEEKIEELNKNIEMMSEEPEEAGKRTYTVNEIQDILGISRNTAYALIKRGEFRSIRIGSHIRVSRKSFDTWLDEQK